MDNEIKKQIAFRMIARVSTGFAFIEDKYIFPQRNAGGPDLAWVRNVYILFSFYFELLLKSELVLTRSFADIVELSSKLKKLGHNIKAICDDIDNLDDIGIKDISFKNGEYKIATFDKIIYVKDFNDIRYDFIEGKVRSLTSKEDSVIEDSLIGANEILEKIKYKHFDNKTH
ncbi:hypothetical protein KKF23_01730 [Patescibacteria group bacterium]|nr:hypothetical protein [Patescibacteria group bacterium]